MGFKNEIGANVVTGWLKQTGLILASAGALLYGVGLLIWSMYLGALGVSDFSLAKPHYLLTGVSACIFMLPPYALFRWLLRISERQDSHSQVYGFIFMIYGLALITMLLKMQFGVEGGRSVTWSTLRLWSIYIQNLGTLAWAFVALVMLHLAWVFRENDRRRPLIPSSAMVGVSIFLLLFFIRYYSLGVHPKANQSLGGAKPRGVKVAISDDGIAASEALGVPKEIWNDPRRVSLVYESQRTSYFEVNLQTGRVIIAVPNSAIGSTVFLEHGLDV